MVGGIARRPSCETWRWLEEEGAGGAGRLIRRCAKSDAVAAHVEKDAEEPKPAPTGSVDRAVKLKAGLTTKEPINNLHLTAE